MSKTATKPTAKKSTATKPTPTVAKCLTLEEVVKQLQLLQRNRSIIIKSRNMQANRLKSIIAGDVFGYHSSMPKKERDKAFADADSLIKGVVKGTATSKHFDQIIRPTMIGIDAFNGVRADCERDMRKAAKLLPVAAWVERPEQQGFGLLGLAIVIGETGNLAGYANPGKVWRRLGCAPGTFNGKTLMGATWKGGKEGKLTKEQWEEFGYSPRRRSIAYVLGEALIKQNTVRHGETDIDYVPSSDIVDEPGRDDDDWDDSPRETEAQTVPSSSPGQYRRRYLQAKARAFETHPEWSWKPCEMCKSGDPLDCQTCGGTGVKCLRAHRHGMLLATKLLLKNLWKEWNPKLVKEMDMEK